MVPAPQRPLAYSNTLRIGLVGLATLLLVGTIGYPLLDPEFSVLDGFYLTLITITTVGFGEIHQLDAPGRVFTSGIIVTGVILVAVTIRGLIESIVEGELANYFGRRRLERQISALQDHWIICGYGRIGRSAALELHHAKRPPAIVVVDSSDERIQECERDGFLYILGDATQEEVLEQAGIRRAAGILVVVRTAADNVYICLTARELHEELRIVSRAVEEKSEARLRRAGANMVVSPYHLGGLHLARAVLRPALSSFLDVVVGHDLHIELEEIEIPAGSAFIGCRLRDTPIRSEHDVIVLAVRRKSGEFQFNPGADTTLEEGDTLLAVGDGPKLVELERRIEGAK